MEFFAFIFANGLYGKFVNRIEHVEDFQVTIAQEFHLRHSVNSSAVFAGSEVNLLLSFLHAADTFLQRAQLAVLRAHEEEQVFQLIHIIFTGHHAAVNANFQGLAIFSPEFFVFFTVFIEVPCQCL